MKLSAEDGKGATGEGPNMTESVHLRCRLGGRGKGGFRTGRRQVGGNIPQEVTYPSFRGKVFEEYFPVPQC